MTLEHKKWFEIKYTFKYVVEILLLKYEAEKGSSSREPRFSYGKFSMARVEIRGLDIR